MKLTLPTRASLAPGSRWYEGNGWALTPKQYGVAFAVLYVLVNMLRGLVPGMSLGGDFVVFQTAAKFVAQGNALGAYTPASFAEMARSIAPGLGDLHWYYPPTFLLVVAPLGLLPALPALLVWNGASLAALYYALRALLGTRRNAGEGLAYGGVFMGIIFGQSSCLVGACICWVLAWRERRPYAAGLALAFAACKPQLVVVLGLILLLEGRWKLLLTAGAASSVLIALSMLCFGTDIWVSWWSHLGYALDVISANSILWKWLASLFAAMRGWGAPAALAYGLHFAVLLAAILALLRLRRHASPALCNSAILTVSCFASPYFYVYDMPMLAAALMLAHEHIVARGWKPWEKEKFTLLWLAPIALSLLSFVTPIYAQPFLLIGFLWFLVREGAQQKVPPATP